MWFDGIVSWLLRSPIHGFISSNTMLITVKGRKSNKDYTTPINYLTMEDIDGKVFLTTSFRHRTWWRNLRGGAPIVVCRHGNVYPAFAKVIEGETSVASELSKLLNQYPNMARFMGVHLDVKGKPEASDLINAAKSRVIIQTKITDI